MTQGNVKSQNLSIMMTDIQGYTGTSSSSSREEIVRLIRRHNQLMVPVITFYGGKVVKTVGDAFLCTFQSATDAVVCSIIIQLLMKEYNQRQQIDSRKMHLRVVVNTGDVSLEDGDIFGDAVNVTSRMEGLECFPGGSIGISESTYLLMNRSEIVAEKIGPQNMRGIPEPVTVYRVPLERQKVTSLPGKLMQLVEKATSINDELGDRPTSGGTFEIGSRFAGGSAGSSGGGAGGAGGAGDAGGLSLGASMNEWTNSVTTFLRDQNWGENIGQIGDNISHLQKQLVTSLSQKSVLDQKRAGETWREAEVANRVKSFGIDVGILFVIWMVINASWWFGRGFLFEREWMSPNEYQQRVKSYAIARNSGATDQAFVEWERQVTASGDEIFVRPRGIPERLAAGLLDFVIGWPFVMMWVYFTLFWTLRGATPGQVAACTAVIMENGDKLVLKTAARRAALFVLACMMLGLPALPVFTAARRTLYDRWSETRVVE